MPTFEEAERKIKAFIDWYHNRGHRGEGMNGKTPLAVWRTAKSLRKAQDDALMILMNIRGQYKVTANGVRVTLNGGALSYGASSNALYRYRGREVLVAVDADYPADCFAYEVGSKRLIGRLEPNERMDPRATNDLHREKIKESQRAKALARTVQRQSASRTRTAVQLVNNAMYRESASHIATGTDHASPIVVNVDPVRTGCEAGSKARGKTDVGERLRRFGMPGDAGDAKTRKVLSLEDLSNRTIFGSTIEDDADWMFKSEEELANEAVPEPSRETLFGQFFDEPPKYAMEIDDEPATDRDKFLEDFT